MALKRNSKETQIIQECKDLIRKNPHLKKRRLTSIKDLEKRLYYIKVWVITESQPIFTLKNFDKRCLKCSGGYHLDHIYPISMGYYNKIEPEIIGNIKNLRFIKIEENIRKGYKITEESRKVLKKFRRKGDIYKKKNKNEI
jgi:hypothetical protein